MHHPTAVIPHQRIANRPTMLPMELWPIDPIEQGFQELLALFSRNTQDAGS